MALGRSWAPFGRGLGRSGASLGHSGAPLDHFLGIQYRAFVQHWSKMGSKRASGSILGRFGEGFGRILGRFGNVMDSIWEKFGATWAVCWAPRGASWPFFGRRKLIFVQPWNQNELQAARWIDFGSIWGRFQQKLVFLQCETQGKRNVWNRIWTGLNGFNMNSKKPFGSIVGKFFNLCYDLSSLVVNKIVRTRFLFLHDSW